MSDWSLNDRPNRLPWPPMLLIAALVLAWALEGVLPWSFEATMPIRGAGLALIVAALGLDLWASVTFRRARTTILPHRGSNALATDGPFRFSRNPIYVGNVMILTAAGLIAGSFWFVALAPALVIAVTQLAIKREEAHLESRFGAAWRAYAERVRRWL